MQVLLTSVTITLALIFLLTGGLKVVGTRYMVRAFEKFGYPQSLRVLAGLVEVVAALGLIAGVFEPWIAGLSALALCPVMVGATFTNFTKKKGPAWIATLLLLGLCMWVAWAHLPAALEGPLA